MSIHEHHTVHALHAEYAACRLTPSEVNEALLARITERNPNLNAYVRVDAAGSRAAARISTERYKRGVSLGPLDGIPVAVKDNVAVSGLARPGAIVAYENHIASADATAVSKLRAAGAIVTGMLNMDEGAFGTTTESPLYGRCHNPIRFDYTPGGSSGGSAAAVAAGLCVASLGTDTLGSVRIPASYCGIIGFKPSHGAIDVSGILALSPTLDHVGVLARTVQDATVVFRTLSDRDLGWKRNRDLGPEAESGLILGVLDVSDIVAADVCSSFRDIAARLASAGVELVEIGRNDFDLGRLRKAGLLIAEAEAALVHETALATNPEGFSTPFRDAMAYARGQSALRMAKAYVAMEDARRWLATQFMRCHAILSPTTPQRAFPFSSSAQLNQADITSFANLAGVPALALPVADGSALPMSVQLVAPFGRDDWLLAIGGHLATLLPAPLLESV